MNTITLRADEYVLENEHGYSRLGFDYVMSTALALSNRIGPRLQNRPQGWDRLNPGPVEWGF